MKTKIFLLSLLVGFSVHVFAQETSVNENQLPGYRTSFKRNKAGDNWFINLSAGGQVYNIDDKTGANFSDRITLIPAISIGKWFSPYWGVRVKAQGLTANSFVKETTGSVFKTENDYVNAHLDAMWNLANYWGVYSPTKLVNFTPYIGLGWAHRFDLPDNAQAPNAPYRDDYKRYSDAFSVNGGLQFGFRLSKRVNLDFDLGVTWLGDYFDRIDRRGESDHILHAMGGFTFNLGKTDFEVIEPKDFALIEDLNNKINALRKENEELSKRPVSCPECPPVAPSVVKNEINYVPNVVFFRLNSSKIDSNQQISVYNTANFMKETGEKIKVIGYADKNTGTSKYNLGLSEKRARAVAKELTTKYNVPSEKISIEWKGSDVQPYSINNWNRVVIMSAQ